MVNKKTNSKKDAVKASEKKPVSANKPVVKVRPLHSTEIKEVPAGEIPRGCVVVPDPDDHKPTFEELAEKMELKYGPVSPLPPIPSVYKLDCGTDCDELIKAGVFASIVSSGEGVKNKADCYISALQAYNYVACAQRIMDGMIDPYNGCLDYEKFKPMLGLLSDKDLDTVNDIFTSIFNNIEECLNCLSDIVYASTYNGDGGRLGGRIAGVEY